MSPQLGFFDGRADSAFFMIDIDGTLVHVKVDRPTHGVTDGGVRYACRLAERMFEGRAATVEAARQRIPLTVRAWRSEAGLRADVPTIGTWQPLRRLEEAVPCTFCKARAGDPCRDAGRPIVLGGGKVLIAGAPWQPEPHEVTAPVFAGAHAGRVTAYHQSLRGKGRIP